MATRWEDMTAGEKTETVGEAVKGCGCILMLIPLLFILLSLLGGLLCQ